MTLKEVWKALINVDLYELYIWSKWWLFERIDCRDCVNTHKILNVMPRCHKCSPVKNLIKNLEKGNKDEKIK